MVNLHKDFKCGDYKIDFNANLYETRKKPQARFLTMFPCEIELNSKLVYYTMSTGGEKPSLFVFVQEIPSKENPGPIYVDAHVTDLEEFINELTKVT